MELLTSFVVNGQSTMHRLTEKNVTKLINMNIEYLLISNLCKYIKYHACKLFSGSNQTENTNMCTLSIKAYILYSYTVHKTQNTTHNSISTYQYCQYFMLNNFIPHFQDEEENGGETHR